MAFLRQARSIAIAALAAGVFTAPAIAASPDPAVQAVDQAWLKAYNAADVATLVNLYADDGCLFVAGHDVACGHDAILAVMTSELAGVKSAGVKLAFFPSKDDASSGDTGWNSGTYTVTVSGKVVATGKSLSVLRKVDGKWRIIRDICNEDPAQPAAK